MLTLVFFHFFAEFEDDIEVARPPAETRSTVAPLSIPIASAPTPLSFQETLLQPQTVHFSGPLPPPGPGGAWVLLVLWVLMLGIIVGGHRLTKSLLYFFSHINAARALVKQVLHTLRKAPNFLF